MPFVFIFLGLLFLVVAVRGTQGQMFTLLKSEFVGTNSFVPWASSIVVLGLIGYARPIRPITDSLIGLILLVILLANHGGFFTQFNNAIRNPVAPAAGQSSGGLSSAQINAGAAVTSGVTSQTVINPSTGGLITNNPWTQVAPVY